MWTMPESTDPLTVLLLGQKIGGGYFMEPGTHIKVICYTYIVDDGEQTYLAFVAPGHPEVRLYVADLQHMMMHVAHGETEDHCAEQFIGRTDHPAASTDAQTPKGDKPESSDSIRHLRRPDDRST